MAATHNDRLDIKQKENNNNNKSKQKQTKAKLPKAPVFFSNA